MLFGGKGRDRADYRGSDAATIVSLDSGEAWGGEAECDTLLGIENLR